MKSPTIFQRVIQAIIDCPTTFRQFRCRHQLVTDFTAEVFTVDKWERCGGNATCSKCMASFNVYIPGNEAEQLKALELN
jgi:transcription elongation factor Elf1